MSVITTEQLAEILDSAACAEGHPMVIAGTQRGLRERHAALVAAAQKLIARGNTNYEPWCGYCGKSEGHTLDCEWRRLAELVGEGEG